MAYNGVKEPRFYIDQAQYLKSIGFDFESEINNKVAWSDEYKQEAINGENGVYSIVSNPELFTLDSANQKLIQGSEAPSHSFICPSGYSKEQNLEGSNIGRYVAFLNHNIKQRCSFEYLNANSETMVVESLGTEGSEILNAESQGSTLVIPSTGTGFDTKYTKGCSIWEFKKNPADDSNAFNPPEFYDMVKINHGINLSEEDDLKLGGISWGVYYDLRSPDLDVELTTEFDGFSTTKTLGGSTITNVKYAGSPWWYDVDGNKIEPWSVGESSNLTKRNGRRVWSLKFSYLSDTDIFASNNMSNNYYEHSSSDSTDSVYNDAGDLSDDANDFRYTLEEDNYFMAQVINRIGNGQRFIFQPDKTNNNPDQFAICMLDMDEFSVKQVAYRTYSFDLKIREVW